jgi:CTP:molybdopterin cytidylyltransferase MocA
VSVAGLILAAGESKRMGSPKALLEFRGETFLDRLIDLFAAFCAPVVVVLGCESDRIRSAVKRPERAVFAQNSDYQLGQLSSMQCGLRMIPETTEGVLFTLVDHPNVQPSTLRALLEAPLAPLAIPRFDGRRGHPIFFRRELIPEFLALAPDAQARSVVNRHAAQARFVDVDDAGILDDVDDAAAYRRLIETA